VVERHLAPALGNGVLVAETGAHEAVRFRHDRIREAVLAKLDTQQRQPPCQRELQAATRTESVERQQLSDPLGYGETTSSTI
jgi:hypothetical protein